MAGKIKNCTGLFYVYSINEFEYIGVTTDLNSRMNKHKSTRRLDYKPSFKVIKTFTNYKDAITYEELKQKEFGFKVKRTSDQQGSKNHSARKVIDTRTGKVYSTIKEASLDLGIGYSNLRHKVRNEKFYIKRL